MKPITEKCRMCGETKPLVKAHIISKKFFESLKQDKPYGVLVDSNKPIKSAGKFRQAGVYDNEILCEDCEKKFSEFDRYGWQILGPMAVDRPPPDSKGETYVYKIDCDTDKLRRFILSVLWRASVSKNPFYSAVNLGPYETTVRTRLFNPRPLSKDEFQTVAMILETGALEKYDGVLFQPFKARSPDGLIAHVLFLPGGLKFVITGHGNFPAMGQAYVMSEPNFFLLLPCPKRFMREVNFVPAMISKMRRAEKKAGVK